MADAGRTEYLSDCGGMFTGATQAINETTVTFEQRLASGFLLREEWRRDASNHPYFLTNTFGNLKKEASSGGLAVKKGHGRHPGCAIHLLSRLGAGSCWDRLLRSYLVPSMKLPAHALAVRSNPQ
jgi:hypothetical protein